MRLYKDDVKKLAEVRKHIIRNLRYHFTINLLCLQFRLNRNKLSAGFKRLYNIGVYAYLKKQRMTKAKTLLQRGVREKQIIIQVGYKNISNFSIAFKKYWGKSPSCYKRR